MYAMPNVLLTDQYEQPLASRDPVMALGEVLSYGAERRGRYPA